MSLIDSCLDGLVSVINDQDTRDEDVCYVNDLPDIYFENLKFTSNQVFGDMTSGSAIITNLTLNTSNMSVGDRWYGRGIPANTSILTIDSATQVTLDNNATETCERTPFVTEGSGTKFFNDSLDFAKKRLKADMLNNFQSCLTFNSVVENSVFGYYDDLQSNSLQASSANWRGLQIKIDRYPYLEFYVHKIRLFLDTAITSTIRVYDLIQGKQIDTINFTSAADEITDVIVNKAYSTDKQRMNLLFVYDGSLSGGYNTWSNKKLSGCCGGCGNRTMYLCQYGVEVDKTKSIIESNVDQGSNSYGMSMTYSLNCTIEPFICSIRNLLQMPLLYLTASHLVKKAQHNERINSYITIERDSHIELSKEYEDEYMMLLNGAYNEQGKKIKQGILDRLVLPRDLCFSKNKRVIKKTVVP